MRYPEFGDKLAVVTGAASGIGAAIATEFAANGARVVLLDVNEAGARATAAEIAALPGARRSLVLVADISDHGAVLRAVGAAAEFGEIRYLVNCAASFVAAGATATTQDWERSLGVNVRGSAQLTAAAAALMRPGAAVVNVSSVSAHIAQPDRWTYNAGKAAIVALTRCQALDFAGSGLRVNCVSPGWIWTPEVARAAGDDRAAHEPNWGRYHMLRRLGEPVEVARGVLFLCSDDASFITGTELMIDGGYLGLSAEGLGETSNFAGSN